MVPSILEQIRGVRPEVCPLEEARKHTHLINSLHEAIPISDIAGSSRAFRETSHGMQWVIPGFDDVLEQAFRSGRLFSEMDVPWAVPSTTSVVRPMREFLGPLPQDVSVSSQVSRRIAALRE